MISTIIIVHFHNQYFKYEAEGTVFLTLTQSSACFIL